MSDVCDNTGTLRKPDVRIFVRPCLDKWIQLRAEVSEEGQAHLTAVEASMWQEFVAPYVGRGRPSPDRHEECMFYERLLLMRHSELRRDICARLQASTDSFAR